MLGLHEAPRGTVDVVQDCERGVCVKLSVVPARQAKFCASKATAIGVSKAPLAPAF